MESPHPAIHYVCFIRWQECPNITMVIMEAYTMCIFVCLCVCLCQVILSSEAEKQAAINRANGEAQAITARAQVTHTHTLVVNVVHLQI